MAEIQTMRTCPHCQATTRQHKAGKTKAGSQRYRCKHCLRAYTLTPKRQDIAEAERPQALQMTMEGAQARPMPQQSHMAFREIRLWPDKLSAPFVKNKAAQFYKRETVGARALSPQEMPVALVVQENRPVKTQVAEPASPYRKWGLLPEIALLQAVILLVLAFTFVAARAGNRWSEAFFWIGLASMIIPVALRQYSAETSRRERIGLILLLGSALYLVKIMHSPYAFTYPDEFSTFRNVREILENQRLFVENPELPATALYPGLATITSLLVSFSGLPSYPAGLLVVGTARLVLFLSLFLLYERVSGSGRIGGLATLFYMGNSNFLFYTSEFSYESLSLPVAIFVLYIVALRETTNTRRLALTVVALFGVFLVVISHHMTSYILTGLLLAATGISIVWTRGRQRGPWELALIAAVATSLWLFYIATYTIKYLSPVLGRAVRSILRLAAQEEVSRALFKSSSGEYISPAWEQLIVFSSLLVIALGLLVGWWNLWHHYRNRTFFLLLGMVSLAFLPIQGLRLTSGSWETANRSSEFLFIGVAFVLALALDYAWRSGREVESFFRKIVIPGADGVGRIREFFTYLSGRIKWEFRWMLAAALVVMIFGGFIAGWPPQARMSRPYLVDTGSHIVQPQTVQVAKWMYDYLGPDNHIATSKVGAKLLSAYGEQAPYTGGAYGIKHVLQSGYFGSNEIEILRSVGIEYIVSDRRTISWDLMIGFYFLNAKSSPRYEFLEFESYEKFDGLQNVHRILDSGDTIIYDVSVYLETPLEVGGTIKSLAKATTKSSPAIEALLDQLGSWDKNSPPGAETEQENQNTGSETSR